MQITLTAAIIVPASPDEVFVLATDPVRFPPLFTGCGPVPALRRITPTGPLAVGASREVESVDGNTLVERITAFEPPKRHAYSLTGLRRPLGWLVRSGDADWAFEATAAGTQVRWTYRWHLTHVVALPLAWPLLRLFMQCAMQRCLRAIATAVAMPDAEPV